MNHPRAPLFRVLGLLFLCVPAAHAETAEIAPFRASYSWKWHDMTVAVSTLALSLVSEPVWRYESTSEPRGIGRLYPLHPRLVSTVQVDAEGVRPLHFIADDGIGTPSRHSDVSFDWSARRASGVYSGVAVDLALKGNEQDDLSIQIAMLVALRSGHTPDQVAMIDKNTVREYQYSRVDNQRITTALGPLDTVVYVSHRLGSQRSTRFWCAPAHGFVPVRVQQKNNETIEWTMDIETLSGG